MQAGTASSHPTPAPSCTLPAPVPDPTPPATAPHQVHVLSPRMLWVASWLSGINRSPLTCKKGSPGPETRGELPLPPALPQQTLVLFVFGAQGSSRGQRTRVCRLLTSNYSLFNFSQGLFCLSPGSDGSGGCKLEPCPWASSAWSDFYAVRSWLASLLFCVAEHRQPYSPPHARQLC